MIDFKARLQNKAFLIAMASAIVLLVQQLGFNIFPENWEQILNTILTILTGFGVVVDTSTPGVSDSQNTEN